MPPPTRPAPGRNTPRPLNEQTIRNLQRILRAQDLYDGPINGQMSARLTRAIRRFQERNGLPVTGAYDTPTDRFLADTFRYLNQSSRPVRGLDEETRDFIEENYGYLSIYLRHPEIGPILVRAANQGWDEARLQGALRETRWWRTTPASVRQWQLDIYQNPADVARRRAAQEATLRDQANRLGVRINARRLAAIVEDSLQYGWSTEQITDALVAESRFRGGQQPIGQISTDMRTLAQLRHRYLLPENPRSTYRYARRIAMGEMTIEDVEAEFARDAARLHPHLADQLQGGSSIADLFDAHRAAIADTLELDPDAVDLTDPRWADIVSFTGEDGRTRAMTVGEAARLARQQPGYRRTDRARAEGAELARTIAESFGRFSA